MLLLLLFGMCPLCVMNVGFPVKVQRETMPLKNAAEIKKKKKKTDGIDNHVLLAPILNAF